MRSCLPKFSGSWRSLCAGWIMVAACLSPLGMIARAGTANIFTSLYSFYGPPAGINPVGKLVPYPGDNRTFYGTASRGGYYGKGALFDVYVTEGQGTDFGHTYSFTGTTDGAGPSGDLLLGSDGNLYGTTSGSGDLYGAGTLFEFSFSKGLTTLYHFPEGTYPGNLVQGSDGNFYGLSLDGGAYGLGAVFKVTPAGVMTTLHNFANGTDGNGPVDLVQGSDGNFYGVTSGNLVTASRPANPTIFKITPAGALTNLYTFQGSVSAGGLVSGNDGNFYGLIASPGGGGYGAVFKVTPAGALTIIHSFNGTSDGANPGYLLQSSDGYLYGNTSSGGTYGLGTFFKVTTSGTLTTLHNFSGQGDDIPDGGGTFVQGHNGNFYGTTYEGGVPDVNYDVRGLGTVYEIIGGPAHRLLNFTDTPDGTNPRSTLTLSKDGRLYGTTDNGGTNNLGYFVQSSDGYGTVFKVENDQYSSPIYTFKPEVGGVGHGPLVGGSDGNLYGTTGKGGVSGDYGTVFKLTPLGVLTTLYSFKGGTDGSVPALAFQGSDGNFYGTTSDSNSDGYGTVFKVTPAGALTTLYTFQGTANGYRPTLAFQDKDGNLYGTNLYGGSAGDGTVFKLSPAGVLTTLYGYKGGVDGANPSGLVQGGDGNFYGTTFAGGTGGGTVFKLTPAGALTTLHTLNGSSDGARPNGLIQGSDGNLYGLTSYAANNGGANGGGTAFRVTLAGAFSVVHTFGGADGFAPLGNLIEKDDHTFYGTTSAGGKYGQGTVFRLQVFVVGYVAFSAANYSVDEDAGSTTVAVTRTVSNEGVASIVYSTADGTGVAGVDYKPVSGNLVWADGDGSVKTFTVPIIDRGKTDGGTRTFSLKLSTPHGICLLGSPSTATLTINENDTVPPTPLAFSAAAYSVNENAGSALVTVTRTGGQGAAGVTYATADGTGVAGTDYTATSGTLSWADGDTSAKTFRVSILDRGKTDGSTRTLTLKLSLPRGYSLLGKPSTATVTINENDTKPHS